MSGQGFESQYGQEIVLHGRLRGAPRLLFNAVGVMSQICSGLGVKTTHIRLATKLRKSGVIPLLPLYAFIAWTGINILHLSLPFCKLSAVVFNRLMPSGHYNATICNTQKFYFLPTQCICVFCVDLRTNSDYFPIQH